MEEIKKEYKKKFTYASFCWNWDVFYGEKMAIQTRRRMFKFIEKVYKLGEENGVKKTVEFMKGKIIDMPVGSGFPLVVKEGFVISAVKAKVK